MAKSIVEELRDSVRTADALYRLIYINIGVYLVLHITNTFSKLFTGNNDDVILRFAGEWLAVPSNLHILATRPWTLITYMFLHIDFFSYSFQFTLALLDGIYTQGVSGQQESFKHLYTR